MAEADLLSDDTLQLRRCVRDLVAISTLPAIWLKHDARQVAESVAEALVSMLGLEFAYVSVREGADKVGIEVTRTGNRATSDQTAAVRAALTEWLGLRPPGRPVRIDNPVGPGAVRVAFSPIGFAAEAVIVAASRAPDFPSEAQRLLLGVAANQMAVALQRRRAEAALAEEKRSLETLNRIGALLAAELDLDRLVQAVTDAGTELTGAQFGAFFYNVIDEQGESYMLYTLSGAPHEAFANFPMPRNTAVFAPTFRGEGIVRSDDITKDPRYGKNAPRRGMPPGHLPVRSYLAVPVISRSGEVLGGLFFGHETPGVFTERAESLVAGIAAHAAVAIDNARLYQAAQREIERRQRVEAALREGRERLRAALEASGTGTFRWDVRTNTLEWDEALDRLFGLSPGETVRSLDRFLALVHSEDRPGVIERCERCALEGADFTMEFRVVWPDGSVHWLYDRGKTFRDAAGQPAYMTGACVDVSERMRAEQALRESEERFRQLANAMPQIVWAARPDGYLDYYNQRWYEFTGFREGEGGDESWKPVLHPDDVQFCVDTWYGAVRSGEPYEIEYRFFDRKTGTYRWHLGRALPIRDEHGTIVRWFGSCTDIDDQKRAAEELQRLTATLEQRVAERTRQLEAETAERERAEAAFRQAQKMEAIGQLTGGVAHDFNNLLMIISGNLELLRQKAAGIGADRQIEAIERAAHRGESLTRQLLAFSRRQPLQPTVMDLFDRLPKLVDLVRPSLRGDIEIKTDVAPDVWPVEVDPSEFELALLNIAVNARDAMPKGGRLVLAVRNQTLDGREPSADDLKGDFVAVSITDTGEGIPAEILPRVFEPFYTTKEVGKGTGLGLSQVYGFARQSGGLATIDSEVGRGTAVTLLLPRSTMPLLPARLEVTTRAPSRTTETVLLVEDNEEVAEVTRELLEDIGCRVEHVRTAQQALDMLTAAHEIDLVVTDIIMPGEMNGLDLARALRQRFPKLPVLLTTGYSTAARQATSEGFIILPKPYQRKALENAVRTMFERQEERSNAVE